MEGEQLTVAGGFTQEQKVDKIAPACADILDHAASLLSLAVVLEVAVLLEEVFKVVLVGICPLALEDEEARVAVLVLTEVVVLA